MSSHYRTLVSSSAKGSHKTPLRTFLAASDSGGGGDTRQPKRAGISKEHAGTAGCQLVCEGSCEGQL